MDAGAKSLAVAPSPEDPWQVVLWDARGNA